MSRRKTRHLFVSFWFIVFLFLSQLLSAAPQSKLIPFWKASNEANRNTIDHSTWQMLLDRYLESKHPSGINRFNYSQLLNNNRDKRRLNRYLSYLQQLDPRQYSKREQKPYWINFYNALTIKLVLDHYPVKSITKIHKGWFGFGPWDDIHAKVAGKPLTLNNIEHGILRPIWHDNRIHYAVNCASLGCPNLASQAYTAANIEILLEKAAKDYVNHKRGVQFKNGKWLVSNIYDWYKVDFGDTDKSVIRHLLKYANAKLAKRLRNNSGHLEYDYDWHLNKP